MFDLKKNIITEQMEVKRLVQLPSFVLSTNPIQGTAYVKT
jgi:hypothetical protein